MFKWAVQGRLGLRRATLITPALRSTQVQTFHGDLLQHMEKNTKLDMQFIKVSLAAGWAPHPSQAGRLFPFDTGARRGRCGALAGPGW